MRAERAAKSEKKSRKKTKKWREIKKKLIKKSTVYQLREFSTVLGYSEEEKEMKPVLFEKITYAVAEIAKMLGISKGAA